MTIYDTAWELFSKTGDIDAYLLYKSGAQQTTGSVYNGERQDQGTDNQTYGLR